MDLCKRCLTSVIAFKHTNRGAIAHLYSHFSFSQQYSLQVVIFLFTVGLNKNFIASKNLLKVYDLSALIYKTGNSEGNEMTYWKVY
jgi:hypothetical protein